MQLWLFTNGRSKNLAVVQSMGLDVSKGLQYMLQSTDVSCNDSKDSMNKSKQGKRGQASFIRVHRLWTEYVAQIKDLKRSELW